MNKANPMNISCQQPRMNRIAWPLLTALALAVGAGCQSTKGYKRADKTGSSMENLQKNIEATDTAIDSTVVSLEGLNSGGQPDPRKAYQQFEKNVGSLVKARSAIDKTMASVRSTSDGFFSGWQADIDAMGSEDVKKVAQDRKNKVERELKDVSRNFVLAKDAVDPWIKEVQDLSSLLNNDLSTDGLGAATGLFDKAIQGAPVVKEALQQLYNEVERVINDLAPVRSS